MKKLRIIPLVLFVFSITLTSCKKEVEDRLPGEWNITLTETTTLPSPDSDINTGTMTFNEDGTGILSITDDEPSSTSFEWYSNGEDKVAIIIDNEKTLFDVVENESKLQRWEYTVPETILVEVDGVDYESPLVIEIKLEKE